MARFLGSAGLTLGALLLSGTAAPAADRALPPSTIDGALNPCRAQVNRPANPWRQRGGLPLVNGSTVQPAPTDYGVVPRGYAAPGSPGGVPVIEGSSQDCGYGRPLGTGRFVLLQRAPLRIDMEFTINDDDWAHDTAPATDDTTE